MKTSNFTVGNVAFTDEGVQVFIPYSESVEVAPKKITYEDIRPRMVAYCNRRMRRCAARLGQNLATAKTVTQHFIAWNGGHFSVPVYQALQEFVNSQGDKKTFIPLILQQVLREMKEDKYLYENQLDPEVWAWWSEEKRTHNVEADDLFEILTEMALVSCDEERFESVI